jgi:hypothetical protein
MPDISVDGCMINFWLNETFTSCNHATPLFMPGHSHQNAVDLTEYTN